jgi:hypothetical protein
MSSTKGRSLSRARAALVLEVALEVALFGEGVLTRAELGMR